MGWAAAAVLALAAPSLLFAKRIEYNCSVAGYNAYMDFHWVLMDEVERLRVVFPEPEPFDPRRMGMLYNVTPVVMDAIVKKRLFPEDFLKVSYNHVEAHIPSWQKMEQHYSSPATFVSCFVLFAILLSIAGLMWCCCHYTCHCRRRRRPFDRKHDACLKAILAILLIALMTLFLFGVVCTFATEQQLEEGLVKLGDYAGRILYHLRVSMSITLEGVQASIERKLVNYSSVQTNTIVRDDRRRQQRSSMSNALTVTSVNTLVDQLYDMQRDLREVQQLTAMLRFQEEQLNTGLRKMKRNLLQTLANCDMPACINLQRKHRIGELNTDQHQYSQMPDVSRLLNNVTALLDGHIKEEVADGQRAFADIPDRSKSPEESTAYIQAIRKYSLRKMKPMLLQTLANCDMPACINLQRKHRIGELNTDQHQYSQIPDVSKPLNNVTALLDGHIKEEVANGLRSFDHVKPNPHVFDRSKSLEERVAHIPGDKRFYIKQIIFGQKILKAGNVGIKKIEEFEEKAVKLTKKPLQYRRYFGLGVASALLSIPLVLTLGLLFGVCGKRPDAYCAAKWCNKGKGSHCLYFGMVLIYATGAFFCAVTVGYFLTSMLLQHLLCEALYEPRDNTFMKMVDTFLNLDGLVPPREDIYNNFNLTNILVDCHANEKLFDVLEVLRLVKDDTDCSFYKNKREHHWRLLTRELQTLQPKPAFSPHRIVLLRDSTKRKLRALDDSGLSDFAFNRILSALETNMTSLELPALARTLQRTADSVEPRGYGTVPAELRAAAALLLKLHMDIVTPMLRNTAALEETAHRLKQSMRFNQTSLKQAVSQVLDETQQAEDFLNERSARVMVYPPYCEIYGGGLDADILGRCDPYSKAFNNTRDIVCRDILLPIIGYWMSVAYCVLLLVPLLQVCAYLAPLYLRTDPYPGPLIVAAYKREKRLGAGRGHGACGVGMCGNVVPRDEYDLAPKHWEEGPPRYHGPATEYKRPPPYYYPGPNDKLALYKDLLKY